MFHSSEIFIYDFVFLFECADMMIASTIRIIKLKMKPSSIKFKSLYDFRHQCTYEIATANSAANRKRGIFILDTIACVLTL